MLIFFNYLPRAFLVEVRRQACEQERRKMPLHGCQRVHSLRAACLIAGRSLVRWHC